MVGIFTTTLGAMDASSRPSRTISSRVMATLSAKGLIEERGRLELPGRPLLYGTTENFLRCLHISSLDELPPLPDEPQDGVREAEEKADADV